MAKKLSSITEMKKVVEKFGLRVYKKLWVNIFNEYDNFWIIALAKLVGRERMIENSYNFSCMH